MSAFAIYASSSGNSNKIDLSFLHRQVWNAHGELPDSKLSARSPLTRNWQQKLLGGGKRGNANIKAKVNTLL